jgi:serine/threonine protein kinase
MKVHCTNLPQIYEIAEKDGEILVLEEFIHGDNLAWLLEESLFSEKEARTIISQLCEGVWVLHSMGAVHRDIKPDNVILRGDEAVLIDFDASRLHKPELAADTQVLGTTGFAAPEQYGIAQTDSRADIFALGVLLNIMLTGEHPSRRVARGKLGKIVEKCTMTNPDKRYQSVLHLMEAL